MPSNAQMQAKKLKFSDNWLQSFKKRRGLKTFRTNGEDGDCEYEDIQRDQPGIRDKVENFESRDVFNAEEFGLLYRMAPDTIVATVAMHGRKKAKERI